MLIINKISNLKQVNLACLFELPRMRQKSMKIMNPSNSSQPHLTSQPFFPNINFTIMILLKIAKKGQL